MLTKNKEKNCESTDQAPHVDHQSSAARDVSKYWRRKTNILEPALDIILKVPWNANGQLHGNGITNQRFWALI